MGNPVLETEAQNQNAQELDRQSVEQFLRSSNNDLMKGEIKAKDLDMNRALKENGATEENVFGSTNADSKAMEAYSENKQDPLQGVSKEQKMQIETFMSTLKARIQNEDVSGVKSMLEGRSFEQKEAIKKVYSKIYGESLDGALSAMSYPLEKKSLDVDSVRGKIYAQISKLNDSLALAA